MQDLQKKLTENFNASKEIAIDILTRYAAGEINAFTVVKEIDGSRLVTAISINMLCNHADKVAANEAIQQIYTALSYEELSSISSELSVVPE